MESLNIWVDLSLCSLPICGIDWTYYFFFWTGWQYLIAQREFVCLSELFFEVFHGLKPSFVGSFKIKDVEGENQGKKKQEIICRGYDFNGRLTFFFWTGGQYLIAQREFLCLSELIFKVFHGCCVLSITPQFSCYQETRRGRRRWSIAVASSVRDQRKYSSPD